MVLEPPVCVIAFILAWVLFLHNGNILEVLECKGSVEKEAGPLHEACECAVSSKRINGDCQPWNWTDVRMTESHTVEEQVGRDVACEGRL